MSITPGNPGKVPGAALLAFQQNVLKGANDALDRAAVILRAEIQQTLSTPGRGRYYAKRRQGKQSSGFNAKLRGAVSALNKNMASLGTTARGLLGNIHRASKPGDPPAPDTATLKRSAFIEREAGVRRVGVATAYAAGLEFGAPPHLKPRPFMRPSLAKAEKRMGVAVTGELSQTSKLVGGP